MKKNKSKSLVIFLIIAFILPILMVVLQNAVSNKAIGFVLYGIQAAAPSISAIAVFAANKELKETLTRLIRKDHMITSILLPTAIVCAVMVSAKLISSLVTGDRSSLFGTISTKQFIILPWAIVAEELGWRGYLEPALSDLIPDKRIVPGAVGLIWCSWHYHYFLQQSIEVPVILFLISCIIESYVYSYLMKAAKDNLVSAMTFHFMYNLMIHVMAINPTDNNGSLIPYVSMTVMEAAVLLVLIFIFNVNSPGGITREEQNNDHTDNL